jgi:hypothetical protein
MGADLGVLTWRQLIQPGIIGDLDNGHYFAWAKPESADERARSSGLCP